MGYTTILFTLLATVLGAGCQLVNKPSNVAEGFGYELLIGRMDYVENTMRESQAEANMQGRMILQELKDLNGVLSGIRDDLKMINGINSCREAPMQKSGIYRLKVMDTSFDVFCEQNLYAGGWIVIQNRFDGSVDFYRNWTDYRNGFGSLQGEFWIGLEKIYLLTSSRTYEMMVHLEDFDGVAKYAHYNKFQIYGEQVQYKLRETLSFNDGTAGNSLYSHVNDRFCTRDRDNDNDSAKHFANAYKGGWWLYTDGYFKTNLNGIYKNANGNDTMHWFGFNEDRKGLKVSKMMIREV